MKKLLRRILVLSMALVMVLAVTACGSGGGEAAPSAGGEAEAAEGAGGETAAAGEPINIGSLFNITGGQASLDEPGSKGFKMAADEINAAGGINGRPINIVAYDGKTDQTTCANNAKRMIDVDKCIAIGGLSDSNYAMAAGNVAQEMSVPIVFSGATTPSLADQIGDCVYLTAFGDDTCGWACADYVYNEMGLTKCYLLTDMSMEFTTTLAKCFRERFEHLGGEIVLEDTYMNKDPDFSAQIDRYLADNKGAEFLFFSGVPDDAGPLIKQYRDKGVTEPIVSGDGFDTPLLWEIAGEAAEGVIVGTHCSFENDDPQMQKFVSDYKAAYGIDPENAFAALGYDAMMIIKTGIEMCGDDVTPQNIRDNLEKIDGLKCVTGTISYKDGHVPAKSCTFNVVKDGKFDFLTVIEEINW